MLPVFVQGRQKNVPINTSFPYTDLYNNWITHWSMMLKSPRFHGGHVASPKTLTTCVTLNVSTMRETVYF